MDTDVQIQVTGDASGIMAQLWQAVYPAVVATIEAAITPATIGAVLVAWMLTHGVKLGIEAFYPEIARSDRKWRFCVWSASVVAGFVAGVACIAWLDHWGAVGLIAVLNGLAWRAAVAVPIKLLRRTLTTQTDRRLMRIEP